MPLKIKRPCRYPGCPALVESGYCDKHQTDRHKEYRQQRTDTAEQAFYRSRDWRITSEQYRAVHPVCERCGKMPTRIAHHNPELAELLATGRDPLDWQYLEGCCWPCHEETKR